MYSVRRGRRDESRRCHSSNIDGRDARTPLRGREGKSPERPRRRRRAERGERGEPQRAHEARSLFGEAQDGEGTTPVRKATIMASVSDGARFVTRA